MKLNAYTFPIVISLGLHALVVGVMTWNWEPIDKPEKARTPSYVQAKVVELTSKAEKQAQQAEQQKVIDMRKRRQEQERREAEQRRQRDAEQRAERQAEERRQETERKAAAEREKREQELAQRIEQERREESERQAQERLSEALAQEDQFLQQQEIRSQALSYLDAIGQRVEQNWSRPPSARAGMQCVLLIQFVPTGQVVDVTVVQSSGNAAFDRSAEQAVKRVGRFPEVQNMPPEVFESQFRQLRLKFNPKDLRL